ncbi:unnamed protein product, partial [Amoebophrya sp. A25]|eukprot:GSA25T00027054001.1
MKSAHFKRYLEDSEDELRICFEIQCILQAAEMDCMAWQFNHNMLDEDFVRERRKIGITDKNVRGISYYARLVGDAFPSNRQWEEDLAAIKANAAEGLMGLGPAFTALFCRLLDEEAVTMRSGQFNFLTGKPHEKDTSKQLSCAGSTVVLQCEGINTAGKAEQGMRNIAKPPTLRAVDDCRPPSPPGTD